MKSRSKGVPSNGKVLWLESALSWIPGEASLDMFSECRVLLFSSEPPQCSSLLRDKSDGEVAGGGEIKGLEFVTGITHNQRIEIDQHVPIIAVIYWALPWWLCLNTGRCFPCIVPVILTASLGARSYDYPHFSARGNWSFENGMEPGATHRLVWLLNASVLSRLLHQKLHV